MPFGNEGVEDLTGHALSGARPAGAHQGRVSGPDDRWRRTESQGRHRDVRHQGEGVARCRRSQAVWTTTLVLSGPAVSGVLAGGFGALATAFWLSPCELGCPCVRGWRLGAACSGS